jgi:hypothetical protein
MSYCTSWYSSVACRGRAEEKTSELALQTEKWGIGLITHVRGLGGNNLQRERRVFHTTISCEERYLIKMTAIWNVGGILLCMRSELLCRPTLLKEMEWIIPFATGKDVQLLWA